MSVLRQEQIERLRDAPLDVLIIGGGINGAGVLRDLALRGATRRTALRVGLVDQAHFGSGTSGKNSQLIHGGLRYLKYLQFRLVRESLRERSVLMKIAPDFVKPLPFLLPMYGATARVLYGTGLALYDLLAGPNPLGAHRTIGPDQVARLEPGLNRNGMTAAAIFQDCTVASARFVVENVLDAVGKGGIAANYVKADSWRRAADGQWRVQCSDALTGHAFEVRARKLVDARGAWTAGVPKRLVRGSHIVIPRVNVSEHAIAHFGADGRIVFLIPWGSQCQLTLVGTTDEDHRGGPDSVRIAPHELEYLLGVVRKLFPRAASDGPISSFSSLRTLVGGETNSATRASRDYRIWDSEQGILHTVGGKYTTYRHMAEEAVDRICREIAPRLAAEHPTRTAVIPLEPRAIGEAMEQHLSDYLFISTYLGFERKWDRTSLLGIARELAATSGWDDERASEEVGSVLAQL